MKLDRWTRQAALTFAALASLLAGCASYVTTQVTAFSNWDGGSDATRTYAFQRTASQQNSLEDSTYEQVVANELATHAFRQVDLQQAHYVVSIAYGTRSAMALTSVPAYYYDPWPGPYYWGRPYGWGGWGPWGPYGGGYVAQSYPVYTHTLGVRITDRASDKEVYNVTARSSGDEPSLVYAMPYLARSAMADFPLGNGVVRTVKLPVDSQGGAPNEVAAGSAAPAAPASGAKTVQ
ncbi:DUF4136 domain-containing protein [Paraburkholderia solisilvae]|uniref:DUF4136 domain-containing protein n=1 Tax=Paraburkholderia solisilvae TaxID=624376 RepID=A0A6J5EJH6_9BURK|nr:DUF4136 domain-containing protein [Paraburkholderia solisilvae]CAB3766373.1 hypothetical protein LMG29739_04804 [Paraburkholderia solisilvae]